MSTRPKFTPEIPNSSNPEPPALQNQTEPQRTSSEWTPMISCAADFPIEFFEAALLQIINHPEYNSTLILRSELVWDSAETDPVDLDLDSVGKGDVPHLEGHTITRCIRRRLLPRRPGRDGSLEQYCTFYSQDAGNGDGLTVSLVILTPIIPPNTSMPYYHPHVTHLAFRFIPSPTPLLRIETIPLPNTPIDPNSRLARTCLALLDTVHRYGWGMMTGYKKRVAHDVLVPRERYQDLYIVLRERHAGLVGTWREVTDPRKHVFEDIGIATYLMLLWKDTFAFEQSKSATVESVIPETDGNAEVEEEMESEYDYTNKRTPWRNWPRPPGGFLDLGCGNGLLTHILLSEGYEGHGIDLRARNSWDGYGELTRERLRVISVDPTYLPNEELEDAENRAETRLNNDLLKPYLPADSWIISNHADELTPWTPILSFLYGCSGYISIPCCPWGFDAKFDRAQVDEFRVVANSESNCGSRAGGENADVEGNEKEKEEDDDDDELSRLGLGTGEKSAYAVYRLWLARLSAHCGYLVEADTLRIPSTRNWGLVGRKPGTIPHEEAKRNVLDIVRRVRERGVFKARVPEGKEH